MTTKTKKQNTIKKKRITKQKRISRKNLRGGGNNANVNSSKSKRFTTNNANALSGKNTVKSNTVNLFDPKDATGEEFELNNNTPDSANQFTPQQELTKQQTWGEYLRRKASNFKTGVKQILPYSYDLTVPPNYEPSVINQINKKNNNVVVLTQKYKYIKDSMLTNPYISKLLNNEFVKLTIDRYVIALGSKSRDELNKLIIDNIHKAFAEALSLNTSLKSLEITDNMPTLRYPVSQFDYFSNLIYYVFEALKINNSLTTLTLIKNRIYDNDHIYIIEEIVEALKVNKTLTKFDISNNYIGSKGAVVIAEALKVNKTLTNFYINNNEIGPEGARAIAEALKVNETLIDLFIYSNNIGPDGARAIAEALEVNQTLQTLNITGCKILNEGALAIAEALKSNTTLTKLYIHRNELSDDVFYSQLVEKIERESNAKVLIYNGW